jgi:hypothetical protein
MVGYNRVWFIDVAARCMFSPHAGLSMQLQHRHQVVQPDEALECLGRQEGIPESLAFTSHQAYNH